MQSPGGKDRRALQGAGVFLVAFACLRAAWICDDACITFRTVDHFVHGRGLVWNVGERVQAYSHPLWMFLVSAAHALTREFFATVLVVQVALTLAALALLHVRLARGVMAGACLTLILLQSRTFLTWSTSGLENPLSHLLLIWFYLLWIEHEPTRGRGILLGCVAGLAVLNRLDLALIVGPPLLHEALARRSLRRLGGLLLGLGPVLLWEAFSTIYYGFPLPNTYYAKLNTGIPVQELISQGLLYLVNSMHWDPMTPAVILGGFLVSLVTAPGSTRPTWPCGLGVLIYLAAVVWAGGDFMTGRFLSVPFVICAAILAHWLRTHEATSGIVALLVLGFALRLDPPHARTPEGAPPRSQGIEDEAAYYARAAGLLHLDRDALVGGLVPMHEYTFDGLRASRRNRVVVRSSIGFLGLHASPELHVIDSYALADPLLARLPARYDPKWRPGHYARVVPRGYPETVEAGRDLMADADLGRFYQHMKTIVSGPLWDPGRFRTIWRMNAGAYDRLIDFDHHRFPDRLKAFREEVADVKAEGTRWNLAGNVVLPPAGVLIDMRGTISEPVLELSLDNNDFYLVLFLNRGTERGRSRLGPAPNDGGLALREIDVPPGVRDRGGYDQIWIRPIGFDGAYSLGHARPLAARSPAGSPGSGRAPSR